MIHEYLEEIEALDKTLAISLIKDSIQFTDCAMCPCKLLVRLLTTE